MLSSPDLALWGGHECSVNRVGDTYRDQTVLSGHQERTDDLDRFASLGIKTLRYPVLWERVSPNAPDAYDWRWSDQRLGRLRDLGIRPIVGLLHHGSGPAHTSLLDPAFPERLGHFAEAAARRYPWVRDWTPINEPLTTARFTSLYGHWHPHLRDESEFWRCLVNQIEGTVRAMRATRRINPRSRLIQTEDLGRTYSTPELAHQAEFDNARRWMTWDLLEGRVTPGHPLWERLCGFGLQDRLSALADDPCPPDVLGVNHYVTSERFLDHRSDRYPPSALGGNDFMTFADVEAVRVLVPAPDGLEGVLREAHGRYRRTLAITESHMGCSREEQMRWLYEAWDTALRLRGRGLDIEAVTAWSLLGAYDWDSLLTRPSGHYEPGAFDVGGPEPRRTGVATALTALTQSSDNRPLAGPGWWRRDIRLQYRPVHRAADDAQPRTTHRHAKPGAGGPVLILGDTAVANAFARACEWRGLAYEHETTRIDLHDGRSARRLFGRLQPWAVINGIRYEDGEAAQANPRACFAVNAVGAGNLALAAAAAGARFLHISSDLVFDGAAGRPYIEDDHCFPLSVLGLSMHQGELKILDAHPDALVARAGPLFCAHDPHNFATQTLRALFAGQNPSVANDQLVSPTYLPDLADASLDLLIDGETGIWHLANRGALSWSNFAALLERAVRGDAVESVLADANFGAPKDTSLISKRGVLLPTFEDALDRFLQARLSATAAAKAQAPEPVRSL